MLLWRVFPYDASAAPGAPFSADCIPTGQGAGRFDVPDLTPVWYFAESPDHAVAEVLQGLRNQALDAADLTRYGMPLALVHARLRLARSKLPDLCDPVMLQAYGVRPDDLATMDFTRTRSIARALFRAGCAGFRWWSALGGDWHTTVLFHKKLNVMVHGTPAELLNAARYRSDLLFGLAEPLTVSHGAVESAARRLSIAVVGS